MPVERERRQAYARAYRERNREKLNRQNREYMRERRRQPAASVQSSASCLACGKALPPSGGRKPRKWCDQNCRNWAARHPGEVRRTERACAICGADIGHLQYKATVCLAKCRNISDGRKLRERRLAIARVCAFCGGEFRAASVVTKCCSVSCAQRLRFAAHDEAARRELRRERNRRKNIKRRAPGIISEPYTLAEIAGRDGFRCGLCRRKVNMRLSGLHARGPTIDHIVPLACGGDDTRINVQLAHRACNVAKLDREWGQQLLIG